MKKLKEFVDIVDPFKNTSLHFFIKKDGSRNRYGELYDILKEEKAITDEKVAELFFGKNATPQDRPYRRLKHNFKIRLMDMCVHLDFSKYKFSKEEIFFLEAQKQLAAIRKIQQIAMTDALVELIKNLYKKAIEFHNHRIAMEAAKLLRNTYAFYEPNEKMRQYYKEKLHWHRNVFMAELDAEEYMEDINAKFFKASRATIKNTAVMAAESANKLEAKVKEYGQESFRLKFCHYYLRLSAFKNKKNYKKAYQISLEALDYLDGVKVDLPFFEAVFLRSKAYCAIYTKKYDEALKAITIALSNQVDGEINWFKTMELSFTLYMHTGEYVKAYEAFIKATNHKSYDRQPPYWKEIWRIYEAYLYLLREIGELNHPAMKKRFNLSKFLNEIYAYSKDKSGMNISVLAAQMLFYIVRKDYDKFIDRREALTKYASRNISKEDHVFQSKTFINLLLCISKGDFQKNKVSQLASPMLKDLEEVPFEIDEQQDELEILPYLTLWNFINSYLD